MKQLLVLLAILYSFHSLAVVSIPSQGDTPGTLCSPADPNFQGYDYPERVARCKRNVSKMEKAEVARRYGDIPSSEWNKYEFDHLIPLCAGGSNDISNLWPQPLTEAREKDKLENEVCLGMRSGKIKQHEAVAKINAWFVTVAREAGWLDQSKE